MTLRMSRSASAFDRRLLRAGRDDGPAPGAEERALAALGLSVAPAPGAALGGRPLVQSAWGWGVAAKVLVVGLGVVLVGAGVAVLRPRTATWAHDEPPPQPSLAAPPAVALPTPSAAAMLERLEQPEPKATESPAPSTALAPSAPSSVKKPAVVAAKAKRIEPPRLSGEIALVQQATRAFSGGETGVALAVLDAYRLQYPHGSLAEEAEVLRAQALARAGDTTQAQALARRLLAADPNGVLAPRLRDLVPEDAR